jgi:hypothetical protein
VQPVDVLRIVAALGKYEITERRHNPSLRPRTADGVHPVPWPPRWCGAAGYGRLTV